MVLSTLALVVTTAGPARGDLLAPKKGPPVRGALVSRTDTEVVFNPYWSTNPAMTYEVVRLPADQVKRVDVEPHAEPEFYRRLRARTAGEAAPLRELARWAVDDS